MADERDGWFLFSYVIAGLIIGFVVQYVLGIALWLAFGDSNLPHFLDSFLLPTVVTASPIWCGFSGLWIGLTRAPRPGK